MEFGYTGKIAKVDLTERKIEIEERGDAFYRSYLGGRGIGYYDLIKNLPAGTDPFSPENILVFATGVMTGAPLPASCRFSVTGKSPLTGRAGESEAAGYFGPELKMAGFDALVFSGSAEKPVYLFVADGKAQIREADHFARLGAKEAEDAIRSEHGSGKVRVAQTGLAGMNRVLFANITNDLGHFNGRNGFGALMGGKNLRAVAALGTKKLRFADPVFLRRSAGNFARTFRENPLGKMLFDYGTTAFCKLLSDAGGLPVNNFRKTRLADPTSVSGDTYNAVLLKKRHGCYACPIRCKRRIALEDPKYGVDSRYGGPEYETMAALGTNLNIFDLKAIAKGNEICNRYCLDTISAGMTIAFACECFENGVIGPSDTGGIPLRFGDPDMMIRLLEMTARREGFGDLLAEGMSRLAKRWGVESAPYNLTVKGQEIPMHDPRIKAGVGIGYAVSSYGADHMNAPHDPFFADENSFSFKSVKRLGIERAMDPVSIDGEKVKNYVKLDLYWKMMDALGLCVFGFAPRGPMPLEEMIACIDAVTGWKADLPELLTAAERGTMLARAFNSREGFSVSDDRLPGRLFTPKPDGPDAGRTVFGEADFGRAILGYYREIGCDPVTGRPLPEKMRSLGIDWVNPLL